MKRTLPFLAGAVIGSGTVLSFKPETFRAPTLEHPEFKIEKLLEKGQPYTVTVDDDEITEETEESKKRVAVLILRMVGGILVVTGHTLLGIANDIEREHTKKD